MLKQKTIVFIRGSIWPDLGVSITGISILGIDDHAFNYLPITPYAYVGNNPILLIDPDGRDWYVNQETGDPVWYEGSDLREGYDHIGPNIVIRGEKRDLYHEQNVLVYISPPWDHFSVFSFFKETIKAVANFLFNHFKEGKKQQHSGENWYIYADGSPSGWEIPAPHANPDGESRSIDISDMFPPGGGVNDLGSGTLNPIGGLSDFYNVVNSLKDRLDPRGGPREAVDSLCNTCQGRPHGAWPYRRIDASGDVIDTIKKRN